MSVNIDQGIHYRKNNVAQNEKQKELVVIHKYGKFWSASLGHFIKHKPLFSEECFYEAYLVHRSDVIVLGFGLRIIVIIIEDMRKVLKSEPDWGRIGVIHVHHHDEDDDGDGSIPDVSFPPALLE